MLFLAFFRCASVCWKNCGVATRNPKILAHNISTHSSTLDRPSTPTTSAWQMFWTFVNDFCRPFSNFLVKPCGNHALDCLKLSFLAVANTIFVLSSSICAFFFFVAAALANGAYVQKNVFLHLGCFLRSIFACCFRKHALTQGPGLCTVTGSSFALPAKNNWRLPRWLATCCTSLQAISETFMVHCVPCICPTTLS